MTGHYETIIGMEVHIELATARKMFCACPADHFGRDPNTQVCPVCLGLPGALPVPNGEAIKYTQLLGLALGCKIAQFSKFDRKNYFYPDLPKGYQISQFDLPFCAAGKLKIGSGKVIGITRVHQEEDTAKLVHTPDASLVDFNRSGVPLAEIVSEPDLRSAEEVKDYLKKLAQVVKFLGLSSCDMEKGTMRLEANISLRAVGQKDLPPYKVEVKNVNSFRYISAAIDYEVQRQQALLEQGITPDQETRGFDEKRGETKTQRSKEDAQDYRYFPEPDIPPFRFSAHAIAALQKLLPELPDAAYTRLKTDYGFSDHYLAFLTEGPETLKLFDRLITKATPSKIPPQKIAGAIVNKKIDQKQSDDAILKQLASSQAPTDPEQLKAVAARVLAQNPGAVVDYKKGKTQVIGYLVGAVLHALPEKPDPNQVRVVLESLLKI